jgi:hypothetical protein
MSDSPSVQTGSYPVADDVMQLARSLVNDMLRDTAGRILTNTAPFSIPYLNSAVRRTQRYFANNGLENFINDSVLILGIPPKASSDPGVQCYLGANGFFDGVNMWNPPALPIDLIVPLALWERQNGTSATFAPMTPAHGDGLQTQIAQSVFGTYEWRNDRINLSGCSNTTDLRIRYEQMIPSIGVGANLVNTTIPLRDAHEALAFWVIYYYAFARGSVMRTEAQAMAEAAMNEVIERHVRKDSRIAYRPRGYRDRG